MWGKFVLVSLLVMALVLSVIGTNVSALDADQKSVVLTVEAGQVIYFDIYMSGGGSADITHTGDMNNWVSHADTISSGEWLEIKIDVPGDADIRSYNEEILADGSTVTKMTVIVTTPVSGKLKNIQNKIEDLFEEQDDLERYIESKLDETNEKITNVEIVTSDMKDDVAAIKNLQSDVSEAEGRFSADKQILQQMIEKLEGDKAELSNENQQLNDLTGMMSVNWSSAGFALGVIVVILVLVMYFKIGPKMGNFSTASIRGSISKAGSATKSVDREMEDVLDNTEPEPAAENSKPKQKRIRGQEEFSYSFKAK